MIFGILFVIVVWFIASYIGWWSIRYDQRSARPFHWTVFIGPWAYYPWLDRQENKHGLHADER